MFAKIMGGRLGEEICIGRLGFGKLAEEAVRSLKLKGELKYQ